MRVCVCSNVAFVRWWSNAYRSIAGSRRRINNLEGAILVEGFMSTILFIIGCWVQVQGLPVNVPLRGTEAP